VAPKPTRINSAITALPRVMPALVAGIHEGAGSCFAWIGRDKPAMTKERGRELRESFQLAFRFGLIEASVSSSLT